MIFDLIYKFKVAICVFSVLAVFAALIFSQNRRINTQNKLISEMEKERKAYSEHIFSIEKEQEKINSVFNEFNKQQEKRNSHFDAIEKKLNNEYDKHTWDEGHIPDPILCIIKCMQLSGNSEDCQCK